MTKPPSSIAALEREAQEALDELNAERGLTLVLQSVEPWTKPKPLEGFYRLRLVDGPGVPIFWIPESECFKQAVHAAVMRDLFSDESVQFAKRRVAMELAPETSEAEEIEEIKAEIKAGCCFGKWWEEAEGYREETKISGPDGTRCFDVRKGLIEKLLIDGVLEFSEEKHPLNSTQFRRVYRVVK